MQEKTILKVSVAIIIIGLLFLFFYAGEIDLKSINNLDQALPEDQVKMKGTITKLSINDKVAFIELEGTQVIKTDVVLFSDHDMFLQEGDYVEISGTVEETIRQLSMVRKYIVGNGNFSEGPSNYWIVGQRPSNVTPSKEARKNSTSEISIDNVLEA